MTPAAAARIIGVISDTHGLLRPDVHTALAGVELILHAGDVGGDEILMELALIAPVRAVYATRIQRACGLSSIDFSIDGVSIRESRSRSWVADSEKAAGAVCGRRRRVRPHASPADRPRVGPPGAQPWSGKHSAINIMPSVAKLTIASGRAEAELIALEA